MHARAPRARNPRIVVFVLERNENPRLISRTSQKLTPRNEGFQKSPFEKRRSILGKPFLERVTRAPTSIDAARKCTPGIASRAPPRAMAWPRRRVFLGSSREILGFSRESSPSVHQFDFVLHDIRMHVHENPVNTRREMPDGHRVLLMHRRRKFSHARPSGFTSSTLMTGNSARMRTIVMRHAAPGRTFAPITST